jgi:uncharacterized protein YcbX
LTSYPVDRKSALGANFIGSDSNRAVRERLHTHGTNHFHHAAARTKINRKYKAVGLHACKERGFNMGMSQIVSLHRYPVKSMMGEELNAAEVNEFGLLGDRAYAIVDSSDGKVASAKNPRKWPDLFDFQAAFVESPKSVTEVPPVRITLPDGTLIDSDQADISQILSRALSRNVTFDAVNRGQAAAPSRADSSTAKAEQYWPDIEGLDLRDTVTDFTLPEGTFFDTAVVHVLTTATLDRLRELYPQGRFEVRRFRPNMVVRTAPGERAFVEDTWIGKVVAIGDTVRLKISGSCPRCVMTTLPQGNLPKDVGILRVAAQHNRANVGVYASVLQGGKVRRGDSVEPG